MMKKIQPILNILFGIENFFIKLIPIKKNRISFVTLESDVLTDDLKMIYEGLQGKGYDLCIVAFSYTQKNLKTNIKYLFNCFKQIYYINTSSVTLIRDNNFVVAKHKRKGVRVIQVWHACGAVKKFGNVIERSYAIDNYDYVIANSDYWKKPYAAAFNVHEEDVLNIGMPRVDRLYDEKFKENARKHIEEVFPQIKNHKVILYAPTFRGNIYKGFHMVSFDLNEVIQALGDDYYVICKYHPLLKDYFPYDHDHILNGNHLDTYELFIRSDIMISDYSSIIFDYSLLDKPMICYVPDLDEYASDLGLFVDYNKMPGPICKNEDDVIEAVYHVEGQDVKAFRDTFFTYQDGKNVTRCVAFIESLINK